MADYTSQVVCEVALVKADYKPHHHHHTSQAKDKEMVLHAGEPPPTHMSVGPCQAEDDSTGAELLCSSSFQNTEATRLEPSAPPLEEEEENALPYKEENKDREICISSNNNTATAANVKPQEISINEHSRPNMEDKEHTLMNDRDGDVISGRTDAKTIGPPEEQEGNDNVHQIKPKRNVMKEDEKLKNCRQIIGYSNDHLKMKGLSSEELDVILDVCSQKFPIKEHLKQILHINEIEKLNLDSGLYFISHGDGNLRHLTVLIIGKCKKKCLYFDSLGMNKYFDYLNHLFDHSFGLKDSFICLNKKTLQKKQNSCCPFCLDILYKICCGVVIDENTNMENFFLGPDFHGNTNMKDLLVAPDFDEIVVRDFIQNFVTRLEKYVKEKKNLPLAPNNCTV